MLVLGIVVGILIIVVVGAKLEADAPFILKKIDDKEKDYETFKKSHEILMQIAETGEIPINISMKEEVEEEKIKEEDNIETINTIGRLNKFFNEECTNEPEFKGSKNCSGDRSNYLITRKYNKVVISGYRNNVIIDQKVNELLIKGERNTVDLNVEPNDIDILGSRNTVDYVFKENKVTEDKNITDDPIFKMIKKEYSSKLNVRTLKEHNRSFRIKNEVDILNIDSHGSYIKVFTKLKEININGNGNAIWLYVKPDKLRKNGNNSIYKKY